MCYVSLASPFIRMPRDAYAYWNAHALLATSTWFLSYSRVVSTLHTQLSVASLRIPFVPFPRCLRPEIRFHSLAGMHILFILTAYTRTISLLPLSPLILCQSVCYNSDIFLHKLSLAPIPAFTQTQSWLCANKYFFIRLSWGVTKLQDEDAVDMLARLSGFCPSRQSSDTTLQQRIRLTYGLVLFPCKPVVV